MKGRGFGTRSAYQQSFYVLSGTVRLYDGNRWIDGRPGDFLRRLPGIYLLNS
jgi:quercetin dioxygenase-like cupin family protein